LDDATGSLKRLPMVLHLSCCDLLLVPEEPPEQFDGFRPCSALFEHVQHSVAVDRVACLLEVQKDLEDRDLFECSKLLEQFGFEDSGPCASCLHGAVKRVMELHFGFDSLINDGGQNFPCCVQEAKGPGRHHPPWEEEQLCCESSTRDTPRFRTHVAQVQPAPAMWMGLGLSPVEQHCPQRQHVPSGQLQKLAKSVFVCLFVCQPPPVCWCLSTMGNRVTDVVLEPAAVSGAGTVNFGCPRSGGCHPVSGDSTNGTGHPCRLHSFCKKPLWKACIRKRNSNDAALSLWHTPDEQGLPQALFLSRANFKEKPRCNL